MTDDTAITLELTGVQLSATGPDAIMAALRQAERCDWIDNDTAVTVIANCSSPVRLGSERSMWVYADGMVSGPTRIDPAPPPAVVAAGQAAVEQLLFAGTDIADEIAALDPDRSPLLSWTERVARAAARAWRPTQT